MSRPPADSARLRQWIPSRRALSTRAPGPPPRPRGAPGSYVPAARRSSGQDADEGKPGGGERVASGIESLGVSPGRDRLAGLHHQRPSLSSALNPELPADCRLEPSTLSLLRRCSVLRKVSVRAK